MFLSIRTRLLAVLLVSVVFGLTACKQQASDEKIHLCTPNNMVAALTSVAQTKGFFKDEGLEIDPIIVTNSKMANDLILAGKADMAPAGDGPYTYTSFQPHNIRIIADMMTISENGVFARKDHGIKTEDDLKGKKIGYLPGTVSFLYLAKLMDKHQWSLSDFTLVPLQPPAMPQALVGGNIDAFIMWEPWGTHALEALGDKGILLRDKDMYNYHAILEVRKEFAEQHPDKVKAFLRAILRAEKFVQTDRVEANKIWAKEFSLTDKFFVDNADLYKFDVHLSSGIVDKLNDNAASIVKYAPDFKDKKFPDIRLYVLDSFLREQVPDRITMTK